MPGPSKLNEEVNIPRGSPNMTRLIFHADPTTGIGLACTIDELLALASNLAPVTMFTDEADMLANTTLGAGYMAYVGETNSIYLYQGPDPSDLDSYILLASGGGKTGMVSAKYKFSIDPTEADPGAGKIRFNSGSFSLVTEIYIDALTAEAVNIGLVLENLATDDSFRIQEAADDDHNVVYKLTGPAVDNDGWWTLPVVHDHSTGALFTDLLDVVTTAIMGASQEGAVGEGLDIEDDLVKLGSSALPATNPIVSQRFIQILTGAGLKIMDVNGLGLQYYADYSATFTARSLIDKQYVDDQIIENIDMNIDGGVADSIYNTIPGVDGGTP